MKEKEHVQAETKLIVTIGIFLLKWAGTSRQRVDGAVSKKLATATVTGRDTARALQSCAWRFADAAEADVEITLV